MTVTTSKNKIRNKRKRKRTTDKRGAATGKRVRWAKRWLYSSKHHEIGMAVGSVILEYINIQGAGEWFLLLLSNNKREEPVRGTSSNQKKLESTPVKTTACTVMCAKKSRVKPSCVPGVSFWSPLGPWVLLGGPKSDDLLPKSHPLCCLSVRGPMVHSLLLCGTVAQIQTPTTTNERGRQAPQ